MKPSKLILIIALLIAVLLVAGCGIKPGESIINSDSQEESNDNSAFAGQAVQAAAQALKVPGQCVIPPANIRLRTCVSNVNGIAYSYIQAGVVKQNSCSAKCENGQRVTYACSADRGRIIVSKQICPAGQNCMAGSCVLPALPLFWDLNGDAKVDRMEGDANLDAACASAVLNSLSGGQFDAIKLACGNSLQASRKVDLNCDRWVDIN